MTVTGILLGAVCLVVIIGVVGAARRRLVDEGSSVRHYQHTMDTLRRLPDRRAEVSSSSPRPRQRRRPSAVLAWRSGPEPVTAPVEELSVSAAEAGPPVPGASPAPAATDAAGAARQMAAARALHGPRPERRTMPHASRPDGRPVAWMLAAVVTVGSVIAVALALGASHRTPARGASSGTAAAPTSAPAHRARRPATASGHAESAPPTSATDSLQPMRSTSTSAIYQVPRSPYTLQLSATGPCWVMATDSATGQVLWTGTIQAGQSRSVPSTAGLVLHLGNASNVTVTVGSQRVELPASSSPTIALTFVVA